MAAMFRIISVGWDCPNEIERTLRSVESQTYQNWQIHIVDDCTPDPKQAEFISDWCDSRDERWTYTINNGRKFALRNQIEGIRAMDPEPEDIVVFLDLDGDQLAHPRVLERLVKAYKDQTRLTYGSYQPVPDRGTSTMARPYPPRTVRRGDYREFTRQNGAYFNHLRTLKYDLIRQVPDDYWKWPGKRGEWFTTSGDYAVMLAGLELARGRYKCLSETLLLYNHEQPHPDNVEHTKMCIKTTQHILDQPRLV